MKKPTSADQSIYYCSKSSSGFFLSPPAYEQRKGVQKIDSSNILMGARGGAVGRVTALHAGMSGVRFPMVTLEFFIDTILPAVL